MNGVATEIAQKIDMLFQHDDVDTSTCEQKTQHEPTRPAADDAATRRDLLGCHS
jgi:hypothetical protein